MINVANVAPQNFSSGSHNGQLPMAHNQLVRILNCWSRLKCRAPESLLEVVTTTRIKRCGRRNVELSLAPMWINSFLTLSYRKRYRSLRKTDVENEKLFDVNDLPEADQKWNKSRKTKTCMHKEKSTVSETASSFPCETSTVQGGDTLSQILPK